jgi:hypothetical protein
MANTAPLSDWARRFLEEMRRRFAPPSAKQVEILTRLADRQPVDFEAVNRAALCALRDLCARWLPGGVERAGYYLAADLRGGAGESLKVKLSTGAWQDFATGDHGKDVISLAAAVAGIKQMEAAERMARMLGLNGGNHA